tara:strand:+ start:1544 stop:1798 length:255 start_codon:yes stop_codon:yes gene_type:complete
MRREYLLTLSQIPFRTHWAWLYPDECVDVYHFERQPYSRVFQWSDPKTHLLHRNGGPAKIAISRAGGGYAVWRVRGNFVKQVQW